MSEGPYPFESADEDEIGELDLEDLDRFGDDRITVGQLVGEQESWRFGHVIVDEAQDLTPMQWRMVMRRVRGRSLTIVGDLAQRSNGAGPTGTWAEHLPAELANVGRLDLTVNYRSPAEIHELSVAVLADFAPDITPSRSIRSSGFEPEFRPVQDLDSAIALALGELIDSVDGQVAVIGPDGLPVGVQLSDEMADRVRVLTPSDAKGLEFDAVVLVEPGAILAMPAGSALLYIALTRATRRLVVLHTDPLPEVLRSL